jgi:glycerol-3-phosphate cytidylyltransferase-like family protein
MKKLLLLLITLTTFVNMGYASFSVVDTLQVKQETLQTDEIKEYHANLVKLGIDISDCKCESCRNNKSKLERNQVNRTEDVLRSIFIVFLISIILFVILIFRWLKSFNESAGIG